MITILGYRILDCTITQHLSLGQYQSLFWKLKLKCIAFRKSKKREEGLLKVSLVVAECGVVIALWFHF